MNLIVIAAEIEGGGMIPPGDWLGHVYGAYLLTAASFLLYAAYLVRRQNKLENS